MAVLAGEDWEPVPETCDCGAGVPCAHGEYLYGLRFPYVLPVWESSNAASGDDEAEYVRQATSIDELPSGVGDYIVEFTPSKVMGLVDELMELRAKSQAPTDPYDWDGLADACWARYKDDGAALVKAIRMYRDKSSVMRWGFQSLKASKDAIEAARDRDERAELAEYMARERAEHPLMMVEVNRDGITTVTEVDSDG